MKAEICTINFSVELNEAQWEILGIIDNDNNLCAEFIQAMNDAGAMDVEFNGHFGMSIYFTADDKVDADSVVKVIENYLN